MERYLVFSWAKYYPQGGMNDFRDDFGTEVSAKQAADYFTNEEGYDNAEVLDTETGQIIYVIAT